VLQIETTPATIRVGFAQVRRYPVNYHMKLLDHFGHSGAALFRLRSYFPLLLLPAFVLSVRSGADVGQGWLVFSEAAGFLVAMCGFAVRVVTIGAAPPGTSGRGTGAPYAASLNTTGPYSLVRHPLYLGNTLVALGLALFTATWFLPAIIVLASLLYHERICVREEVFLEATFGDAFRSWVRDVPALRPSFAHYRPAPGPFQWKNVIGREFHALFVIGTGFLFLDVLRHAFASGRVAASPTWTAVFVATGVVFVVLLALKKWTSLLRVSEPAAGGTINA
jgi:protein-S-isoprenylcysteine O-methyltransferase Ste14